MRKIRLSGSEGGGTDALPTPIPTVRHFQFHPTFMTSLDSLTCVLRCCALLRQPQDDLWLKASS
jgi:hypothetical protein